MQNEKYDYVVELKRQFEIRNLKNKNYSLRAYARDLEILPSRLSDIINYKKGLSADAARKIATNLGFSENEIEVFILSAKALHARSDKDKKEAVTSLKKKLKSMKIVQKIDYAEFELANNWYHLAILELIELRDCDHSIEWFAEKLSLNKSVIKSALLRLQKINWITFKNGKYKASYDQSETTYDISSLSIKKFHEEILKKAEHALYFDHVNEREFLNMTLAFTQSQMTEAKEFIRQFQKDFADKFYTENSVKDSVCQLSIQLFRLDSGSKEN
ncbi:MAG: TIGR02147 family protein [Rhizobacter sp.]|nr:TIGR02147 family protein [Bacteriovorax sp.]